LSAITRRFVARVAVALVAVAVVVVASSVLTACGGVAGGGGEHEEATVTIEAFDFQPDPLTVTAGTRITFVNRDAIDHTVTAGTREQPEPDVFDGELPELGATFELTLDEPGTYRYFCRIHAGPGMTGTIEVTP